ncbi:MAG: hypothetical protein V4488_04035 [Pseudomonadota bacterium]
MNDEYEKNSMSPNLASKPVSIIGASLLTLACSTGCVSPSYDGISGDIPSETELALSPNGKRLLVSWKDRSDKAHAKLLELNGSEVASMREITLPTHKLTTAFAKNDEQILVTTWDRKSSEFYKINLANDEPRLIYKSAFQIRFPLEVSDENYIFLEGVDANSRSSQWQRYQHGQKSLLNEKHYNLAAPLNVIDGALFLLEPFTPPAFRSLYGTTPVELNSLVDSSTFFIRCADKNPLTCLRSKIHFEKGPSYSTMEIFNGKHRCEIDGRWVDLREDIISRDGSTVVFHAALNEFDGPRAIYIVKNVNLNCTVNTISIKGS